jgi:3-ketosteroid 9alpha-monooxygenase subunit A
MGFEFEGYARGWFVIGWSQDLTADVLPMRYFGKKLVAYRDDTGAAVVLDAICPHLGADLGAGGVVVDGTVRCPFHHWRFGSDGGCKHIPYSDQIPKQAKVKSWPVREVNGILFVWHDRDGAEPDWEPPVLKGFGEAAWTGWSTNVLRVKTHPREIVENVADKAHFPVVHGTHVDVFENEYREHLAIQNTKGVAYPRGGGKDTFENQATYYGPAFQLSEMKGVLNSKLLNAHTPIDENTLDLRFGVMLAVNGDLAKSERFAQAYVDNLTTGFHEDIAIWENKAWRDMPVMCAGDGPIGRLRQWYRQFYQPRA